MGCGLSFLYLRDGRVRTGKMDWGLCQELKIYEFDSSSGDERELMDGKTLSLAFFEKHTSRRLVLFVDVVDKL